MQQVQYMVWLSPAVIRGGGEGLWPGGLFVPPVACADRLMQFICFDASRHNGMERRQRLAEAVNQPAASSAV